MFAFAKNLVKQAEGIIANQNEQYGAGQPSHDVSDSELPTHGFRVLHVKQNSPASEAGIEALFDFIIGLNGHPIVDEQRYSVENQAVAIDLETAPIDVFLKEIDNCRGRSVTLDVWTSKGRVSRSIIVPVEASAEGDTPDFGLGMTVQWTSLEVADHVWHVLNVAPNSPAEEAGLISHADYIVGAENGLLESGGESLLARVVSKIYNTRGADASIELYVYNHDYDTLRPVSIAPNAEWGGSGLLGCGVGYGLLHRLPLVVAKKNNSGSFSAGPSRNVSGAAHLMPPGQTLFDADHKDEAAASGGARQPTPNYIVPANLGGAAPPMPAAAGQPPPRAGLHKKRAGRHHAGSDAGADLSAYFAEEEARSKEVEGTRAEAPPPADVPPPPHAKA
jgi:hypothetical protein